MNVLVLAGGEGQRMKPLTEFVPKPMMPLVGRPILEQIVTHLAVQGMKAFTISVCHLPKPIEDYLADGRRWGVEISYQLERDIKGPLESVRRFALSCKGPCVVWPGDVVGDVELRDIVDSLGEKDVVKVVALSSVEETLKEGAAGDSEQKDTSAETVDTGIFVIGAEALQKLRELDGMASLDDAFRALSEHGCSVREERTPALVADIDTFVIYLNASRAAMDGDLKGVRFIGSHPEEGVWLGRNVSIHPTAHLNPPVVIGDDCLIRSNVVIGPHAEIGNGVIIDADATVKESIVHEGVYVGEGTELVHSIVRRKWLISVKWGTGTYVAEDFLLGDVSGEIVSHHSYRFLNLILGLLLFMLFSPLFVVAAILVKLTSRGPLFEKTPMVGPVAPDMSGHKRFEMLDFRTHIVDEDGNLTDRETFVGRLLNALHLTGLPRLLNLIRGDVNLVGMSPISVSEADDYGREWLSVRGDSPVGLVSLWHVTRRYDTSLDAHVTADAYYSAKRSFWQDVKILFKWLLRLRP